MINITPARFLLLRLCVLFALVVTLNGVAAPRAAAAVPTQAAIVDDYAANYLGGPWDMSDSSSFGFDYTRKYGNVSDLTLADGVLSANATNNDPRVTLLMASPPAANPTLPEGGYAPIDANVYRYLTVRINVAKQSYAQVFWQAFQGASFDGSAFQQVNPGWQTLVFDLTAAGKGSSGSWSGTVQALYFDPMMTTGAFQIDYVRLSSAPLADPDDMPPTLHITAPSYTSGPDYASTELGNPWDMSDAADTRLVNVTGQFVNGILTASTGNCSGAACGDPQIVLHVGPPIDTSKYKYATYRMKIDSLSGVFPESVSRFLWWSTIPEQASTSKDIVVYEGWRTVSLDLSKAKLEADSFAPWGKSKPTFFRFDPHEETTPRTFSIDYILLTGDNTADSSFDIRYETSDPEKQELRTQFFYDTDAQGFDGQPITCAAVTPPSIPEGKFKLFLPSLTKSGAPSSAVDGATCRWETDDLPAGSYFIYGVTTDGSNTTRVYSQTPLIVKH